MPPLTDAARAPDTARDTTVDTAPDTTPDTTVDASRDVAISDLRSPDAAISDIRSPDAAPTDDVAVDTAVSDVPPPDAARTDDVLLDAALDTAVSDVALPDAAPTDAAPTDVPGPDAAAPPDATPDTAEQDPPVIVVAGDSWSTGAVGPLRAALPEWGAPQAVVIAEETAIAGSRAAEWVANQGGKLDALVAALDGPPAADVLLLFLGGNDFNFAMQEDGWSQSHRDRTIDRVEDDLEALVTFALAGRPDLTVVLVDYSYFNYLKMRVVYGFDLAPNLADFNWAYVWMGERKRAIAARTPGCEYAHNFGILQYTYGDEQRMYPFEPWVVPAYDPGAFPAPGGPPDYAPYPGGQPAFPAPDPALFDGLHPTDEAMRVILDNVHAQVLGRLLATEP